MWYAGGNCFARIISSLYTLTVYYFCHAAYYRQLSPCGHQLSWTTSSPLPEIQYGWVWLIKFFNRFNLVSVQLKKLINQTNQKHFFPIERYVQDCPGLTANEMHTPHDRHHNVSLLIKVHQNTHNFVKYEVTWKWQITQSYMKYLKIIPAFNPGHKCSTRQKL